MEEKRTNISDEEYEAPTMEELIELALVVDPKDPEGLKRPYFDSLYPTYDYTKPLKITGIEYRLGATLEEVNVIKEQLEATKSSLMIVVPFYDKNGELDPSYYEIMVVKDFCTRHIFDDDCQYNAMRWGYDGNVFRIAPDYDDGARLLRRMHHKLTTHSSPILESDVAAKNQFYQEHRAMPWKEMNELFHEWYKERMKGYREE